MRPCILETATSMDMGSGMTSREQEILRRTELSETRVTQAFFPLTTNHHNSLFGGTALAWMDEVSFIAGGHAILSFAAGDGVL
ncbi:hypothetical protein FBY03_12844 [Pseudomonas sp. SJZ079]|nr:hypothetical protein FBY03_12844 [Pseudomonas sp. SJZ079]